VISRWLTVLAGLATDHPPNLPPDILLILWTAARLRLNKHLNATSQGETWLRSTSIGRWRTPWKLSGVRVWSYGLEPHMPLLWYAAGLSHEASFHALCPVLQHLRYRPYDCQFEAPIEIYLKIQLDLVLHAILIEIYVIS